jgi:cytochrome c-type biogenesis protein CcmE
VDLSPRDTTPPAPRRRKNNRKWVSIGLLVLVLAGGGLVLSKFLTSSLDYYCNVDEVGHKTGCEKDRRLRIQGTVNQGSLKASKGITTFNITFNKATLSVVYDGDPGGLFQECIPVVVHGELKNGVFAGDEVEVKHSNNYIAANPNRINEANKESAACSQQQ